MGGSEPWMDPSWGPWRDLLCDDDVSSRLADERPPADGPLAAEAEEIDPAHPAEPTLPSSSERAASLRSLVTAEQEVWTEMVNCIRLTRTVRGGPAAAAGAEATSAPISDEISSEISLPEELLCLRPPPPPDGWPVGMPTAPPPAAWLASYPVYRRAQRLSYVAAAMLPSMGKQRLLTCASTAARLEEILYVLRENRERLAALAALKASGAVVNNDEPPAETPEP